MANPSKRKGTTWEAAVVAYLREHGQPYAERRALAGVNDKGDVSGVPGIVFECKAERSIDLAGYMTEVATETANAGAQLGVAVVKRRNRGPGDAYVVMSLSQFVEMLADDEVN
jgi:predicted lipoprotein